MLRGVSYQLAKKLSGFAELLLPAAKKHREGAQLSLDEMFDEYLLDPLEGLEAAHKSDTRKGSLPVVVLLLDALHWMRQPMACVAGWQLLA